ncbi:hypothetical protein HN747_03545 [archaeon]|nr:hypothetical protein [archaeon]
MRNLYYKIYEWENLKIAWQKARKGKTRNPDIKNFEEDLIENLQKLQFELMIFAYSPLPLASFPIRDPKTRKISKSDFRDRIVHHALINIIQDIFEKSFIHDSCANQKGKGTLFAIKRFEKFKRKVTNNLHSEAFCLKADVKHYFQEVDHKILLEILERRILCKKTIWLIKQILENSTHNIQAEGISRRDMTIGMPLGNLTSQFFANIYLNELDYFVKHKLKIKYYIRYVDDFVILHKSKEQLGEWKEEIKEFLMNELKLELHPQKTKVESLSKGIDFVGFRIFYNYKLLRKRCVRQMEKRIELFLEGKMHPKKFFEIWQGWLAHARWASSPTKKLLRNLKLRKV